MNPTTRVQKALVSRSSVTRLVTRRMFSVTLLPLLAGVALGRLMNLPGGAEDLIEHMETSFSCRGRSGYFADEEHHCRVYHLCTQLGQGVQHYSFVCGNQTIFDQLSLTCRYPEDSVPCEYSTYFSYVNERIGGPHNLHYEGDIERAAPYTTERYDHFLFDRRPAEEARSYEQEYQDLEQRGQPRADFAENSEPILIRNTVMRVKRVRRLQQRL